MSTPRPVRAVLAAVAALLPATVAAAAPASASSTWSTYHGDVSRSGVAAGEPGLDPARSAWADNLDGSRVYASPVVADGRVFVATEADDVYALDAHDGRILWRAGIGSPLRNVRQNTGCGNIDPLGITSTPVVDPSTGTVYVVGEVSTGGALPVAHVMVGLDVYTGQVRVREGADPANPGGDVKWLQQRAALAESGGRIYVAYGGLAGDCGTYHGWVVGLDTTDSRPPVQFDVTPQSSGGAIWNGGGGPSVDSAGDLYVTTGNPNSGGQTEWSESVVKLTPGLSSPPLHAFRDPAATGDADLGSGDALLLPGGLRFTAGKAEVGYVLRQSDLSLVAKINGTICGSDPDGGATYDSATDSVYVPCTGGGIQQVRLSDYRTGWRAGSVNASPILVAGKLWAAQSHGTTVQELDPATGAVEQTLSVPAALPTFATPAAAAGLLVVGTDSGVAAFDGPAGPPPPAPGPPAPTSGYRRVASDGGVFAFGTDHFYGSTGGTRLTAPIVGAAATPDGRGYWLVAADGGVFSFGTARFYGSTGGVRLARPVVGMAATGDGGGYWLVASDGGVFAFGDARFRGSTGGVHLASPVVAMAAAPAGGYWLFAADGGVFAFGAPFYGSTGAAPLAQPVVGAVAAPGGRGYWMVARDGGIFAFGPGAGFAGSTGGTPLVAPIVAMAADPATGGYWLMASDGGVFAFHAPFEGSMGGVALTRPVVAATGP